MEDTYLFIDGENFLRNYSESMQSVFHENGAVNFEQIRQDAGATRVFYYDCIDDEQRPGEKDEDFQNRLAAEEKSFKEIDQLKGFHVRWGSLKGKRKGKPRRQKEVDVLLAVDMLSHAFDRNMKRAVLISGDLDFRPVVAEAVRRGVSEPKWIAIPEPSTTWSSLIQRRNFQTSTWASSTLRQHVPLVK
jgi:uncharacterized LabA/DUF88 family protein